MARRGSFLSRSGQGPSTLLNTRNGAVLAAGLELATTSESRRRGLLGREGLAPGAGLAIAPCTSIHTWFMRFPIDVLFVARDGTVQRIAHSVGPWRIRAAWRAFAAIELPAGTAASTGTREGDRLTLETLEQ